MRSGRDVADGRREQPFRIAGGRVPTTCVPPPPCWPALTCARSPRVTPRGAPSPGVHRHPAEQRGAAATCVRTVRTSVRFAAGARVAGIVHRGAVAARERTGPACRHARRRV